MRGFTLFIVAGMHRSGTSLVGEVLNRMGIPMGKHLLQANEYNARGYFEDSTIVEIHDRLLAALGRPWGTLEHTLPLPNDWLGSEAAGHAKSEIIAYLSKEAERNRKSGCWSVKDPRICLFLPLWQAVADDLGVATKTIFCVRNVEAVASSLSRRDELPVEVGRLLWLHYNAHLIRDLDSQELFLLSYDAWRKDPEKAGMLLAEFCGREALTESPFDKDLQTAQSEPPSGIYGEWQSAFDRASTKHSISPKLISCSKSYFDHLKGFDVWTAFLNDPRTGTQMSKRLAMDLEEYKENSRKLDSALHETLKKATANHEAYKEVSGERDLWRDKADEYREAYEKTGARLEEARAEIKRLEKWNVAHQFERMTRKIRGAQ